MNNTPYPYLYRAGPAFLGNAKNAKKIPKSAECIFKKYILDFIFRVFSVIFALLALPLFSCMSAPSHAS